jgi:hypothetical protein
LKANVTATTTIAPKKDGTHKKKFDRSIFKFASLIVTSSKTTTHSTTEKPGKGKLKANATTIAPKKEGVE